MQNIHAFATLLGRILLSTIFLLSGATKLMQWDETAAAMGAQGMPAVPFFLAMAALTELVGGALILVGYKASWAALALAAFLVPVTLTFHHFWTYEGGAMVSQMQNFLKNLAIIGGLLTLAASGAGRFALDSLARGSATERRFLPQKSDAVPVGG